MVQFPEFDHSPQPARPTAPQRDWLVFWLAAGCLILAGVSICLGIATWRRYTPKVITKEVVIERPATVEDAPVRSINRTSADLIEHMMKDRGFLISHQDPKFVLLCESENPKRVYVAIDLLENGLIARAEVSMLMRDAVETSAVDRYLADCMSFAQFFGDAGGPERQNAFVHVMKKLATGFRDYDTFATPHCSMRFDRGPRDYQDAFILTAKPLE